MVIVPPFWCCFDVFVVGTRTHEKAILKPPSESKGPRGDSRTAPARKWIPFWGLIFIVFRILGCLEGSLAQVWKRMPKRSETRPSKTLKIVFPCTREHSFHFRHATLKLLILSSFLASFGIPLSPFIEISCVFLGVFFLDRVYGCILIFGGARCCVWGAQGRVFRRGNPSRRGV